MNFSDPHTPVFGSPVAGAVYEKRPAAYAVIRNDAGAVAAVRVPAGYWLPGGGALPGETPEETVVREVREELGRDVRLVGKIGAALQYFFARSEDRYYEMTAVFFRAEFVGELLGPGEYNWCWYDTSQPGRLFFHACHDWAVRRG
jgi:8-oxo-dGTP pyrophosphatase MutT (NUDIX family)